MPVRHPCPHLSCMTGSVHQPRPSARRLSNIIHWQEASHSSCLCGAQSTATRVCGRVQIQSHPQQWNAGISQGMPKPPPGTGPAPQGHPRTSPSAASVVRSSQTNWTSSGCTLLATPSCKGQNTAGRPRSVVQEMRSSTVCKTRQKRETDESPPSHNGGVWQCVAVCGSVCRCVVVCGGWCVVVCGGVWWCVVVCGGVWWCVVVCGGVWWCVPMCGGVWWVVCGGVWWCVVVCGGVWWCVVVCGGVWWCVVVCGGVWWCVVVCGGVWWCVVVCGGVWWCVVVCGGVWRSWAPHGFQATCVGIAGLATTHGTVPGTPTSAALSLGPCCTGGTTYIPAHSSAPSAPRAPSWWGGYACDGPRGATSEVV